MAAKLSPASLERSALFRLERASLSEAQLRRALLRKVARAESADDAGAREWVDAVVEKMKRLGFVDDARTATARATSLRAAGTSRRGALVKLRQKGYDAATAASALAATVGDGDAGEAELAAARAYVRRRRLHTRDLQKALAALGRRGFSYDVARRALASPPSEG